MRMIVNAHVHIFANKGLESCFAVEIGGLFNGLESHSRPGQRLGQTDLAKEVGIFAGGGWGHHLTLQASSDSCQIWHGDSRV